MQISDERIGELQRLYKDACGEEISFAEARDMGQRLVELYRSIMQLLPDENGGDRPRQFRNDSGGA
jgi:hypothetical protein